MLRNENYGAVIMISQIEISLRCWHPGGKAIHPSEFLHRLSIDVGNRPVAGSGEAWQAARVIVAQIVAENFAAEEEPSEAFSRALQQSLLEFVTWISGVTRTAIDKIREDGFAVDVFVDALIDQNQLDFDLPPEVATELSRLGLAFRLVSNS